MVGTRKPLSAFAITMVSHPESEGTILQRCALNRGYTSQLCLCQATFLLTKLLSEYISTRAHAYTGLRDVKRSQSSGNHHQVTKQENV